MKIKRRCNKCRKTFLACVTEKQGIQKYCSMKCRGHTGFRPGGNNRISEATAKEKLERLKNSFVKHVIRQEGCWDWKGSKDKGGYGVMSVRRQLGSDRAHRASWIIHKGKIPKGMCVCHFCDNPICTNPDHLWLGNHKENNDDKIRKCREAKLKPPHKIGSENGTSKLNEEQVKEIKKLIENGSTSRYIGFMYGVSKTTILRIRNNKNWKHVKLEETNV